MDFKNKTVWVTGASSGMGRAVALYLAKQVTTLIISGRNVEELKVVASEIEEQGTIVIVEPFDIGDEKAAVTAAQNVLSKVGKIDALYQFAGISQRALAGESSMDIVHKIMNINFFGTVALAREVMKSMIENGGGHIAVTSSIVGKFGFPFRSSYSASKHALHGFFESVRAENVKNNIRVSIIIPGRIRTNISFSAIDSNGMPHGKMDAGQDNGLSTEKAAVIICRGLRNEKKEIPVGGKELLMLHIRRFLPAIAYKMAANIKPV